MSSPTSPPPESARQPGGTSQRGLGLFRACPAVLPPLRQCGLRWRRRRGRVRHGVRGAPPRVASYRAGGAGEPCGAGSALGGLAAVWALAGAGPELSPAVGGGENGSVSPPSGCASPTLTALPRSAGRSRLGRFGDRESPGPRAEEGRVPSALGGGGGRAPARRREARG